MYAVSILPSTYDLSIDLLALLRELQGLLPRLLSCAFVGHVLHRSRRSLGDDGLDARTSIKVDPVQGNRRRPLFGLSRAGRSKVKAKPPAGQSILQPREMSGSARSGPKSKTKVEVGNPSFLDHHSYLYYSTSFPLSWEHRLVSIKAETRRRRKTLLLMPLLPPRLP